MNIAFTDLPAYPNGDIITDPDAITTAVRANPDVARDLLNADLSEHENDDVAIHEAVTTITSALITDPADDVARLFNQNTAYVATDDQNGPSDSWTYIAIADATGIFQAATNHYGSPTED